jgi:hypothetical protein
MGSRGGCFSCKSVDWKSSGALTVDFGGGAIVKGYVLQSGASSAREVVVGGIDFVD